MILLAVGTLAFARLVKKMDEIAPTIEEEMTMQIGETKYTPKNARYFDFASEQEMKQLYREARIAVTHAGVGTILDALQEGTAVVAVPRRKRYHEHIDDHQVEFVRELEKEGKVRAVYDLDELREVLLKLDTSPRALVKDRSLVDALKKCIVQFERRLGAANGQ